MNAMTDQTARITAHVEALGAAKTASDSLTGNLLVELAIAATSLPDWSALTNDKVTDKAIESVLQFSCRAFAKFGESESARTQFQNNEKRRIALILKKFSVTGKIETIYRLSTGKETTKPLAFAPQIDANGFAVGLRFTRKIADSDPFEGFEHDSETGESAQAEIDRLNAEKKAESEAKAIQDRAQQLAIAMSVKTQQALDDASVELGTYRDELHELRSRLAVKEMELFNANERIAKLETDNARLAHAVAEFDANSKPVARTRKTRV